MTHRSPSLRSVRSIWARWAQLFGGIFIFGVAITLMIQSGIGLGPWDAFHYGLHRITGISVGVAIILVGIVLVGITYLINVRPGPGTIANMILIGVVTDLVMHVVPEAGSWLAATLMFLAGVFLTAFATGMYIGAGLGIGPRDGVMIGISRRTGWQVGRVRTGVEIVVLVMGWAMGGVVGIGTIIFALTIGPATQWGLRIFGVSSTGVTREEVDRERELKPESLPRAA